jgi:hypothetical protein
MLLLRHNPSLPDLDASSLRLRSLSYPSYNTPPSKQLKTALSSQPFSMCSSTQDRREKDPGTVGPNADADDKAPSISNSKSLRCSPSHAVSSTTPLNDPHHARVRTPCGIPSACHQSFPSQRHPASLSRHHSEPNMRSTAAPSGQYRPLLNATETCYQRLQRHRRNFLPGVTPIVLSPSSASFSASPSTAGSVASSGWEPRGDFRAEPSQERAVTPTPTHGVYTSIWLLVDTF